MQPPDSKEIEILSFRQTTKGRLSPAFLYLNKMKQIQLKSIPDHYSDFAIYIMYSENMDIIYMAIFQISNHAVYIEAFLNYVEIQQFNSNKKVQLVHCGKGDKRMLIFVISTLRETGIQIKQHEYSMITFDENMLEECLKES